MKDGKKPFSLTKFAEVLCVLLLAAMTLITFINVLSRYVFHSSISASEEITTNLFVMLSLVGAALAAQKRQHLGLNLLPDKLSPKGKLIHRIYEGIAGMAFMGYLSWYGLKRVMQQASTHQISTSLSIPVWIYGCMCLLGFVVLFAVFAEIAIEAARGLKAMAGEEETRGGDEP
ncbi:MAG: TRAP transporter small permease [Oscillospiraceae bacterium]|nr:TRAP transporter small permease [Oscillospiraceae bacterium]